MALLSKAAIGIVKQVCGLGQVACAAGGGLVHSVDPAVNHVMGIAHELDLIIPLFQNICLGVLVVIAGHLVDGEGQGDGLALAGVQQLGLVKGAEPHMGFFDAALGVGSGVVELDSLLAGDSAGVGDGDIHGDLTVSAFNSPICWSKVV